MTNTERRRQGDSQWNQRFEEFGLSDQFELIARDWNSYHGTKASVKCKTCGCFFDTWNVKKIFDGKVSGLTCPECGMRSDGSIQWTKSSDCDDAMNYYAQGHSVKDTAKKYDVPEWQITNIACARNVSNGRDFHAAGAAESASKRRISKEKKEAIKKAKIFEREQRLLSHRKQRQKEIEEQKLVHQIEIEKRKRQKEAERFQKNPLGLSDYQLKKEKKLDEVFVCKECGKEYTPRQYMESCGIQSYSNLGFCSYACRRKAYLRRQHEAGLKNYRRRAHKYGCDYDSSVNLKKLIKRDGLRCGICGRMCNPFDNTWNEHFGASSPTLDHIIPLAKGGSHTWDNVQVAHAICNSCKKDDMKEVRADDAS